MPNILLFSDDEVFAKDLRDQIEHHAEGFAFNDDAPADIIIVDEDFDKLEELHARNLKAPLLFLTTHPESVRKDIVCRVLAKPMHLSEFLDEVRAGINLFENSEEGYLCFNRYVVRPIKKDIINLRNNEVVKLTEKEVAVLKYLYKAGERIVGKNELLQEVWGYSPEVTTHTIETHIYRLRQKVEHDDASAQLIITLDGGYRLKF